MHEPSKKIKESLLVNAIISELVKDFFNSIPIESLKNIPAPIAIRVGNFMVVNGYRLVFDRWYLQSKLPIPQGDENGN